MDTLLKKRRSLSSQIKVLEKSTEGTDELTVESLQDFLEQVGTLRKDNIDLHDLISVKCADDAYEQHEEQFFDLSARINKLKASFESMSTRHADASLINRTMPVLTQSFSLGREVRLPRLDPPTFNGDIYAWMSFHDLFKTLIHENSSLTGAQKLQYLKASLKGEPSVLIQGIPIGDANYEEAWGLLKARYECKREIIRAQFDRLVMQPNITGEATSSNIRKLVDTTVECVRSLEVMKLSKEELFDLMVVHLVANKLDSEARLQWERSLDDTKLPSLGTFTKFLDNYSRIAAAASSKGSVKIKPKPMVKGAIVSHYGATKSEPFCELCKGEHSIFRCETFMKLPVSDRILTVKGLKLCFNCLRKGHCAQQCSSGKCRTCYKRHHTLIHIVEDKVQNDVKEVVVSSQVMQNCQEVSQVLLATALVRVKDGRGSSMVCRAFLDSGSQGSFVTEDCVQRLGLPRQKANISISGITAIGLGAVRGCVQLFFSALETDDTFMVKTWILPKITKLLPRAPVKNMSLDYLRGLQLADPKFFQPAEVDILLGADIYGQLLRPGYRSGGLGLLTAMETALGWVIIGPDSKSSTQASYPVSIHHVEMDTDVILQRFWELESVPTASVLSDEERLCEEHFAATYVRDQNGRFRVKLPMRDGVRSLGDSRELALRRLFQVEHRLDRDLELKAQYVAFMDEYEVLGHMTAVPVGQPEVSPALSFYMPHHPVLKEDSTTTRLRVVFDASAKSLSGISLNDKLMVGPRLQEDLFNVLIRFRIHIVAFTADIEKMYRQIGVDDMDTHFQRILWRRSPVLPVTTFCLKTVTYGTASASYQAVRCLQELADLNRGSFPEVAVVVKRDFYVDDLMSGAASVDHAIILRKQIVEVLQTGGFVLRKWSTNSPELMRTIPMLDRGLQTSLTIGVDDTVKVLGVHWNPTSDCFLWVFHQMIPQETLTKRFILSYLARVYDPLGWLSPVTICAKIIFQEIWKLDVDWDTTLPNVICAKWEVYQQELHMLERLRIKRCVVLPDSVSFRLVGFCDASEAAYAAVVYLVTRGSNGDSKIQLIAAKTKVAPVKFISLPRLELCAAVLLVKLLVSVQSSLCLELLPTFCWSDSTIVLAWLSSPSCRWKTFVANRVAVIQESDFQWRHVLSEENPADCASRGIQAKELLDHHLWWTGPVWLLEDQVFDVASEQQIVSDVDLEEKVSAACNVITLDVAILEKFSSLTKLQRVTAYCLRFMRNSHLPFKQREFGFLTVEELEVALQRLIHLVQSVEFQVEIQCLLAKRLVPSKSRLRTLNPFLDEHGLLRVGGRLSKSQLSYNMQHPIILPGRNRLTKMIVSCEHLRWLHAGPQLLRTILGQRFWILGGRDIVRQVVHQCLVCHRQRVTTTSQLMADLPAPRVLPCIGAFGSTGVDFAGPLTLRVLRGRGQRYFKGYVAIFVCFATRACHLELVSGLTADAFVATLKRFVSRRGKPRDVYSDCGTNFVGAKNQLDEIVQASGKASRSEVVQRYLVGEEIQWHFNPPGAPHFGGLWEAGVKSVKYHLRRVVGKVALDFEEMSTVLTQIEACLNSRPLTPLSSDQDDLQPLTPGHFLIGRAFTSLPDAEVTDVPVNRLSRWQLCQRLVQDFWRRWHSEYLASLQQRPKWQSRQKNIGVGDLVLLKDDHSAPLYWKLGRVIAVHPGQDGLVRVVTLKTADGECRRPVVKISLLPCDREN